MHVGQNDNKKNFIAIAVSLGVHLVLLLMFLFLVSWKAPNPPLSALGGIELNFGLDNEGSGEIQPTLPVGSENPTEAEPISSNQDENNQPENLDNEPEKITSEVDDTPSTQKDQTLTKKKENPKAQPEKPNREPEVKRSEPNEVTENVRSSEPNPKKGSAGNHGDDISKVGDKGSPQGKPDANALYGNPGFGGQNGSGVGGGFALQMAGWTWDEQPKAPKLPDNENGRVVFEIEVDEEGEITSIKTLERSLSPEAERICKQEVLRRSLIKTSQGATPERSKGKVAFVLRTQ